jgi:hypothetical protein
MLVLIRRNLFGGIKMSDEVFEKADEDVFEEQEDESEEEE